MTNGAGVLLLLLIFGTAATLGSNDAEIAKDKEPLIKPSDDPFKATMIIITVLGSTTMSVLVLLVPTLLYYKYCAPKNTPEEPIKI